MSNPIYNHTCVFTVLPSGSPAKHVHAAPQAEVKVPFIDLSSSPFDDDESFYEWMKRELCLWLEC